MYFYDNSLVRSVTQVH